MKGKYYALNFPLRDGISDENYKSVFEPVRTFIALPISPLTNHQVIRLVMESYDPSAIVLQCGTDSLSGDKLGCLNLSMRGRSNCFPEKKTFLLILENRSRKLCAICEIVQQTIIVAWRWRLYDAKCKPCLGLRNWSCCRLRTRTR